MEVIKKIIQNGLLWTVNYQIHNNLFSHQGKFKIGDIVIYNWKAKAMIASCVKERPGFHEIIDITKYKDSDGLVFKDVKHGGTTGCDAFWCRKMNLFEWYLGKGITNQPKTKRDCHASVFI